MTGEEVEEALRPPDDAPAAALPLAPQEGVSAVALPDEAPARAKLVSGPLGRTVARVAIPAVAGTLLMTAFGTADAYWVGTRIGGRGLAAVSISVFWIWAIIALAEMVAVGLTAVAARRHGAHDPRGAARAVGDALLLSLALGTVVSLVGHLALDALFAVMHAPDDVTALGRRYLGTYLLGAPLIFGFFAIDAGFRASGDTQTPFMLLAVSVSAGIVLDPVLILGLGPAPELGIAGAAAATVLTRGAAFLAGVLLLARARLVAFGRIAWGTMGTVARIGLPTALTGIVFSNIYVILTRTTTRFGTPALAALGVGHRVESWAYMIGVGFGAAAAAVVGQNLGAREVGRAARAGWIATALATTVASVVGILEFVFAEELAAMFTTEPAVIAESVRYLRISALSTMLIGAELVLEGALGGAGYTLAPMLTSTSLTALRIPLAAWAATRWGTSGIWWTISITALARALAMIALWRAGRWKGKSM
jgi:putative MATE family efflux protein